MSDIVRVRLEALGATKEEVAAKLKAAMEEIQALYGGTWIGDDREGSVPDGMFTCEAKQGWWGNYTAKKVRMQ